MQTADMTCIGCGWVVPIAIGYPVGRCGKCGIRQWALWKDRSCGVTGHQNSCSECNPEYAVRRLT